MDGRRRRLLQGMAGAGVCGFAGMVGLPWLRSARAAWPQQAFAAKTPGAAVKSITGAATPPIASDKIKIRAPEQVTTGTVVPVEISTRLPQVESIVLLADGNPFPLIASFRLSEGALPYIFTCVELVETSNLMAVVQSGGKLYSAGTQVRVAADR